MSEAPALGHLLRARAEARAQVQVLAQANPRLETFLGVTSHELRGPVMSSSLAVQVAARHLDVLRNHSARQGRDAALAGELAAVQKALMPMMPPFAAE